MKTWIKVLIGAFAGFGGGFAAGYFARKKLCEVQIEEVSEEELDKMLTEAQNSPSEAVEGGEEPFGTTMTYDDSGAKETLLKQWKEQKDAVQKYDTRSTDTPDDVETVDDGILDEVPDIPGGNEVVEDGTRADWAYACDKGEDNGEYDPIELIWYEGDDVVCDEDGEPLEDSDKYLGFDIAEKFQNEELAEASGDKDVRIVFNHQHHSIFFVTRRQGSYSQHKRLEELGSDAYDDEDDEDDRIREWVHSRR